MKFIWIDLQNDFASEWWYARRSRPCVSFIKNSLVPFFAENNIKTLEIISDYRLPRKKAKKEKCVPWTWWYQSILPDTIKTNPTRIKSMHSPLWVRKNRWTTNETSYAYQDIEWFDNRIKNQIWSEKEVILYWLTLDCCVLSIAQELSWRWFKVYLLNEWVDMFDGKKQSKDNFIQNNIWFWAKPITFSEVKMK